MATVEQCEPQTTGLGTLSSTLDLFDSYKPLQEEEKDSDEESFHLPMLDCDDDLESNNKEPVTSDIDKDTHDETEDDILNKFETTGTPDIDPKIEDSILEDIEELCEKKPTEENKEANNSKKETSQEKQCDDNTEIKISFKEENKSVTNCETAKDNISSDLADIETEVKDRVEIKLNGEKQENEKAIAEKVFAQDVDMIEEEPKEVDNHDKKSSTEQIETEEKTGVGEVIQNNAEDKLLSVESSETPADKKEEISVDAGTDNTKEKIIADEDKDEKTEEESKQILENVESVEEKCEIEKSDADLSENMDVDMVEPETELSQINGSVEKEENKSNEVENTDQNNDLTISSIPNEIEKSESMDVENPDIEKIDGKDASENIETTNKGASDRESATSEEKIEEGKVKEDSTQCEISDKETNKEGDMEKPLEQTAADKPEKQKDTVVTEDSKSQKMEPDKCENSNDSGKNLECDDLLDISIIRDADEDNASAIAENANDARSSEKSDNDDQDEGSEKADNELDESEMDQEESLLATDKDDNMDFEDGSSNLGDQDNTSSGNTSDSETKDDVDTRDSENDSKESSSSSALKETKTDKNELDSEKTQTDKPKDVSSGATVAENEDTPRENTVKVVVNGKRSLSETEKDTDVVNKKIKLSGHPGTEEKKSSSRNNKVKTLVNFEKYMQDKKLKNKLSRSDLEQFCLQKICEAIMHKTDVGELHQTIKKQEIIIENLRKDLQQLSKQTRDLDIVNKKLMNELKAQNGNKKPLVPLKITRSVGLQVKLNVGTETNNRRKVPVATTPRTPNTANTNNVRPRTIAPANTNVVRQVAQSPRKTPSSTPLLSQALQNNRQPSAAAATPNTAKRTPIRSKPAETQKPANQNVIVDLTDEDDKAAKNMATPVKILNKTVPMTQAKTINIVQAKPVPNKTINNQTKTVAVGQAKTTTVGAKVGTPTRTVTTLPQGVRLTPTQVKNGSITLPASVVTSSAGTTQLMYVVQPTSSLGQVVTTTAGGTQKAVLLNFQPTNGVLTSTLNGSAVSVIPTKTTNTVQLKTVAAPRKHPAPLPSPPVMAANAALKPLLPKPHLSIRKTDTGIILQWRMPYNLDMYEGIASYQLFAYQETNAAPSTDMWRKVGDVKALALPMACTLTQFADKNKYYFAVRSVDVHKRIGAFSDPEEISL